MSAVFAQAVIYKTVAPNGAVTFSDTPSANSTQVNLNQMNITNSNNAATSSNTDTPSNQDKIDSKDPATDYNASTSTGYSSIAIVSPENETTFQNQYDIVVKVQTKPDLLPQDMVQLILDGAPAGKPAHALEFKVANLSRGTHIVQAVIIADGQRKNVSNNVTFYIHQPSQLLSPR